ncbi:MAG TPA: carboxypeptidase regulatory-like domain-containing protein, partial [Armatimonadetes bacterium]|nr:carboxypeptidase regulatory-like domain-containing protein [Armatimonadota bacterium]
MEVHSMKRSIIVAIGFCIMSALLVCIYGCGGGESATQSSAGNTTQETGTIRGRVVLENRQAANDLIATIQDADISAPVNADGSFELTGVPTGEQVVSIIGQTQNLGAHLTVMVRPNATTDIGEVRPRPTGMISGIVSTVNEDGQKQPVARARVRARPISSNTETLADLPNGRFHLTARTNPQGEYVLRAVPPGTYLVTVEHPDYEPAAKTVEVEALKGVTANFELTPRETTAGIVRGRVMARFSDEEALLPLADA